MHGHQAAYPLVDFSARTTALSIASMEDSKDDSVSGDMIVTHEPEDDIAYMVVAGFTDETDWNAGAAQ